MWAPLNSRITRVTNPNPIYLITILDRRLRNPNLIREILIFNVGSPEFPNYPNFIENSKDHGPIHSPDPHNLIRKY